MNETQRVRQGYGYVVCLIAVVTALYSVEAAVKSAISLSDPVAALSSYANDISSFEAWTSARERVARSSGQVAVADTESVETLKTRFELTRAGQIAQHNFAARQELATRLIMLAVAVALFVWHWRWLREPKQQN